MLNTTKTYSVYLKKDATNPLEEAVFVPEGFNLFAFIFGALWALFHRLWFVFVAILALEILVAKSGMMAFSMQYALILVKVWFGFEASNFRAASLERSGYILYDVSTGSNETDAQRRFFDKYTIYKNSYNPVKRGSFGHSEGGFAKTDLSDFTDNKKFS